MLKNILIAPASTGGKQQNIINMNEDGFPVNNERNNVTVGRDYNM